MRVHAYKYRPKVYVTQNVTIETLIEDKQI